MISIPKFIRFSKFRRYYPLAWFQLLRKIDCFQSKPVLFLKWMVESPFHASRYSGNIPTFFELWFIMAFAFIDLEKNRFRRTIRALFSLVLYSAAKKEIPVLLRFNGKKFSVKFGNQSPTEFWSIRSILIEILYKESYQITLPNPPKVIIDAGANVGIAALFFASQYPDATLYCYEPSSESYHLLQENLSRNNVNFLAFQTALFDKNGFSNFSLNQSSMVRSILPTTPSESDLQTEQVNTATLSSELDRLGLNFIDLIKFDVEGAEIFMLDGLEDKIDRIGAFVGEVHNSSLATAAKNIFTRNGFQVKLRQDHIVAIRSLEN